MCHMIYYAPGIKVDESDLRRAAEVNNEGHGWAIGGRAMIWNDRDLQDADYLITQFAMLRGAMLDRPAVFHSRLATTGKVTRDEVHPIIVKRGEREIGVFLNGTLDIPRAEDETDTRRFAEEYIAGFPNSLGPINLDDWIGVDAIETMCRRTGAKIALLRYGDEDAMIFNRDAWIVTPYGALASNLSHLGKGKGWDERTEDNGDVIRWRYRADGEIEVEWNETERRARVLA